MNRSCKYALVVAGLVGGVAPIAAEESHNNSMRLEQLVYFRADSRDSSERFAKLLEAQPTAAGIQPADFPAPSATGAAARPGQPEIDDGQQ